MSALVEIRNIFRSEAIRVRSLVGDVGLFLDMSTHVSLVMLFASRVRVIYIHTDIHRRIPRIYTHIHARV